MAINCFGIIHHVKAGESLWKISQIYNVKFEDIINANPQISDPNNISINQEICIPGNELKTLTPTAPVISPSSEKFSMSYLHGSDSDTYLENVDNTKGSLNEISPDFFEISSDGNLIIAPESKLNKNFIDHMHNQNIKVVPYISNNWDRDIGNKALENRDKLSTQISDAIKKYNLDGINVDIENVNEQYRDKYNYFVKNLRDKLPKDKEVVVSVGANPYGWTTGWHGSYDYKELSNYADYLMLMAYDESYNGGPQGPVSSKDFFEKSIDYAINQGVPKEKIVVGVPFFGRYWKEGEKIGGYGIPNKDIENLISNYESNVNYDDNTKSTLATIIIKESDEIPTISDGRNLTPGTYYIWYDNDDSLKYKLDTINKNNLKGVGSWSLGQEDPRIYDFYSEILNSKNKENTVNTLPSNTEPKQDPDPDLGTNQNIEKNTDTPASSLPNQFPVSYKDKNKENSSGKNKKPSHPDKEINVSYIDEIINSLKNAKDPSKLNNNKVLTRTELLTALASIMGLPQDNKNSYFEDTYSHWGNGYINSLYNIGILNNKKDKKIYPDQSATKGFTASIINKVLNLPELNGLPHVSFNDVDKEDSNYDSIKKLYYLNLINPESKNKFNPNIDITVKDLAKILENANKYGYKFVNKK